MIIFTLIIFGLATLRTFNKLKKEPESVSDFIGSILFVVTHVVAYIYLLKHFLTINSF
jgi:hypothetical protein